MVSASLAVIVLQAAPRPAWYDEALLIFIVATCVITVVVTAAYPWSWRFLGTGLLAHFAAVGLLFGRAVANLYPRMHDVAPYLRSDYQETTWLIRLLLIYGSVAIAGGLAVELWKDMRDPANPLTWRAMVRRLVVLAVITGAVWGGLIVAHRWRN
jgi:hypothetical protein